MILEKSQASGTAEVVLVDLQDNEIGVMAKDLAHQLPNLHRAFSVFVHAEGKMLIQQRALAKYHCGGIWANTCCSHPRADEKLAVAVERRLQEETGIKASFFAKGLHELFAFSYFAKFSEELFEYEYDHVFVGDLGKICPVAAIDFDGAEIAQMQWIAFADLLADMRKQPQKYAPWFIIAAPLVIQKL